MNWAELSYELGRVVLVRDFIGPSGLVRVVFGPSCPAPHKVSLSVCICIFYGVGPILVFTLRERERESSRVYGELL